MPPSRPDSHVMLLQPEARRAAYPGVKPPGVRPPPSARTVWPAPEPRDFRDAPNRPGQFYPQHEPSPTPSPRSWQGAPHGMDPTHSQGPMSAAHPAPRYGSPAHFDPTAPGPRDGGHLANSMRFQEEAERRPSPRSRPWSRGPSMDRAWQQPQMRGSGPGSGPASYGPGPQGGPRPLMNTGPPRYTSPFDSYCLGVSRTIVCLSVLLKEPLAKAADLCRLSAAECRARSHSFVANSALQPAWHLHS